MLARLMWYKRHWMAKGKAKLMASLGKRAINLLLHTCRFHVSGLDPFRELVKNEKCVLMLWHNRLVPIPYILNRFTPETIYAALISASRDGNLLSAVVKSYRNGRIIQVSHQARHQALREIIRQIDERQQIVVMTPDGPRGPRYELKPGIAVAALETQAHVVALNWTAEKYWELRTWDRLRIPKPFTTIHVSFESTVCFNQFPQPSLEEAKTVLDCALSKE